MEYVLWLGCCLVLGMQGQGMATRLTWAELLPFLLPTFLHKEWMLHQWHQRQQTIRSIHVEFRLVKKRNPQGKTLHYQGTGQFLRKESGFTAARLRWEQVDPQTGALFPDSMEEIIIRGNTAVWRSSINKTFVRLQGQKPHLLLSWQPLFLLPQTVFWTDELLQLRPFFGAFAGIATEPLLRRVQLDLEKRDPWYTYVSFRPAAPGGVGNFAYARVVLMNRTLQGGRHIPAHFPREVYWVEADQNETTWDISRVAVNQPGLVRPVDFALPAPPPGWTVMQRESDPAHVLQGWAREESRRTKQK